MLVYSHDDYKFYKCLTKSTGVFTHCKRVGINEKTLNTSRIFSTEFREWLHPHFYHRVTY